MPPAPPPAHADEAHQDRVLVLTDIVDSTRRFTGLGEVAAAALWAEHDAAARALMRRCAALELERGDGFLLLFEHMADAAAFAQGYHALLARLSLPLTSRIGIHRGPLRIRANAEVHVAAGARALDLDGQAKAITARIQSLAQARQTLASAAAVAQLPPEQGPRCSHGHWQLKGVPEPMELFEIGPDAAAFAPPPDAEKVWRVVRQGPQADALWLPARQVPHSLPAERDRFVGRRGHLNALAGALEQARLVSLLGTGGTGKTRLSLRHGWSRLGDHSGGVWFCDLSAATTPDGIVHATAQGLQLPLGAADPVRQVGDAIAGRGDCLVILDNFEQVARHAESTLGQWLQRAPQAHFLVTTREVLGIVGEHALALPPLDAPEGEALLRERAAAAGAQPFSRADDAAVVPLVQLLDGLPLAIELAASRMSVMGPAALLPRMNERFQLLVARRGRHDRQATLRATLDWSWDLLTDPERSALAQLSVFEGGFTLEAAQAVVDLSDFADDADDRALHSSMWVVDVVQGLVDKSLVRRVGGRRFDLLRSVQEYADAQLRGVVETAPHGGEARRRVKGRHVEYFAALAEEVLVGDGCKDLDNLVSACRWAMTHGQASIAATSLLRVWTGLRLTGPFSLALDLARDLLAVPGLRSADALVARFVAGSAGQLLGYLDEARGELGVVIDELPPDAPLRTAALCALGELESVAGRADIARSLLVAALESAGRDADLRCRTLNALGALAWEQSRLAPARQHYEEALHVARQAQLRRWEGALLGNLGTLAYSMGQLPAAETNYRNALVHLQDQGDLRFLGNTYCNLGMVLLDRGELAASWDALGEALRLAQSLGDFRLAATCMTNIGLWQQQAGQLQAAGESHRRAVETAAIAGDPRVEAQARLYLGRVLTASGRLVEAEATLRPAVDALDGLGDQAAAALARCALAAALMRLGRLLEANALVDAARCAEIAGDSSENSELARELERLSLVQ